MHTAAMGDVTTGGNKNTTKNHQIFKQTTFLQPWSRPKNSSHRQIWLWHAGGIKGTNKRKVRGAAYAINVLTGPKDKKRNGEAKGNSKTSTHKYANGLPKIAKTISIAKAVKKQQNSSNKHKRRVKRKRIMSTNLRNSETGDRTAKNHERRGSRISKNLRKNKKIQMWEICPQKTMKRLRKRLQKMWQARIYMHNAKNQKYQPTKHTNNRVHTCAHNLKNTKIQ